MTPPTANTNPNRNHSLLSRPLLQIPVNLIVPSQPLKELIGDSLRPLSFRFTWLSLRRNQGISSLSVHVGFSVFFAHPRISLGAYLATPRGVICVIELVINYVGLITVTLIRKVKYDYFHHFTNPLTNKHNRTIMRSMKYIGHITLLMLGMVVSTQAVPPV